MHFLAPGTNSHARLSKYVHIGSPYKSSKQPNAKKSIPLPTQHTKGNSIFPHFFLPFLPLAEPPADTVEATLDALDGVAELFLLDLTDLTLSSALFCKIC